MVGEKENCFTKDVADKLGFYVYRLIDPRNGETFYVGKGKGNRVFMHAKAAEGLEGDEQSNKIKRIREIKAANLDVVQVIHRHGMDENTALEVEAALIDAYPGLSNLSNGVGSDDFGAMHTTEVIAKYTAQEAVFRHKALLINVNRTFLETSTYEATRFAWRLNKTNAEQAEVILATCHGLIVDAFVADKWLEATIENFPLPEDMPERFGFEGKPAPEAIRKLYVGKRVPAEFQKKGAANPIKYTFSV